MTKLTAEKYESDSKENREYPLIGPFNRSKLIEMFNARNPNIETKEIPINPVNVQATEQQPTKRYGPMLESTSPIPNKQQVTDDAVEEDTECGSKEKSIRSVLLELCKTSGSSTKPMQSTSTSTINDNATEVTFLELTDDQSMEPEPLQILDLNDDCLERILLLLDLNDVINVAGSCTRLNPIACTVLKLKLRKYDVLIDCDHFDSYTVISHSRQSSERLIGIEAFLTAFGKSNVLKKLIIRNMAHILENDPRRLEYEAKIRRLIVENCGERLPKDNKEKQHALKERSFDIKFHKCGEKALDNMEPLERIKAVSFECCSLTKDFNQLFPNMQKLDVIDCDVSSARESLEKSIQKSELKSLSLIAPLSVNTWTNLSFNVANTIAAIEKSPQIQDLHLCHWNGSVYDANLLKNITQRLPLLKSLQLWHFQHTDFNSEGDLHFMNVRKFSLANHCHTFGLLDKNLNGLSFHALKKFCITGEFDSECITFIARHKTIKELFCVASGDHDWYPTNEDVHRFGTILPDLEKLVVSGNRLTPTGLIKFISQCKSAPIVQVCRYTISAPIRRLFQCKCAERGWKVSFNNSMHEFTMKKIK